MRRPRRVLLFLRTEGGAAPFFLKQKVVACALPGKLKERRRAESPCLQQANGWSAGDLARVGSAKASEFTRKVFTNPRHQRKAPHKAGL
jgi:hypothetical protein